jgi:hypothetical protein
MLMNEDGDAVDTTEPVSAEPTTAEPTAAEPTAEPVAAEPAGQVYDFDADAAAWNDFDPYAENAAEFFPEYLRPVHQRLHQVYDSRIRGAKGDSEYYKGLYEAAITGGTDSPAVAQLEQERNGFKTRYDELESQYAELQAKYAGLETTTFEREKTQQESIFNEFWTAAQTEIQAAPKDQTDALMTLIDLPHKDSEDLLFFDSYEDAWAIAKAGKAEEAIKLHGQGVPAEYIPKLVLPTVAASPAAATRPQPSPTAAIIAGADDGPSPVETTPVDSTPKPVHKVPGLSHRSRIELAIERAQGKSRR